MNKGRNIFWGLIFILGALALVISKMGFFGEIGFWSILFSIVLAGSLIDGIWHLNFGVILFSAAFLIIVNDSLLGLESITPWPVLGAALLGTIGLSIIFPNKKWKGNHFHSGRGHQWDGKNGEGKSSDIIGEGGEVWFENSFGETVKYLDGSEISKVHLKSSFGCLNVYFDGAVLKDGRAEVFVENSFGSIVLYVPRDWRVEKNVSTAFADASEKGHCNPMNENTLVIRGSISFGDLEICYL